MSVETLAAFLHRVLHDAQLRSELSAVAERHGYLFSPDELRDLDIETLSEAFKRAEANAMLQVELEEDDSSDPGFGIIEIPA